MQGRDKKGIVAGAATYLAERDINIDDFYSYVHDGRALVLAQVSVPAGTDVEEIRSGLERVGQEFGLAVALQHENVFRATSDVRPVMELV